MEISIEQVRSFCAAQRKYAHIDCDGSITIGEHGCVGEVINTSQLRKLVTASDGVQMTERKDAIFLQAEGYEPLALTLQRAFIQAAHGKGKERHAQGEPFTEQVMQDMARRFGVGALLGQAFKKSEESQRLPHDKAVAELLGAINYLAGAVIAMERKREALPPAANDNEPHGVLTYA